MNIQIVPFLFLALASGKDLEQGQSSNNAHKIYDEKREANVAIWRQIDQITVNATNELISRVVVTDLRDDKAGEANIIAGGVGNDSVTIELKSPTALRGFAFHIEVYAAPENNGQVPAIVGSDNKDLWKPTDEGIQRDNIQPPKSIGVDDFVKNYPVPISTEVKINDDGQRRTRNSEEDKTVVHEKPSTKPQTRIPIDISKDEDDSYKAVTTASTAASKSGEVTTELPGLKTTKHTRHVRDTLHASQPTSSESSAGKCSKCVVHTPEGIARDSSGKKISYPQSHLDKTSGNTDKLLIPDEFATTNDKKEEKENSKANTSPITNTSEKPRAVRDTSIPTTPKTEPNTEDIVYPQWRLDKTSGNTDKLLIPDEFARSNDKKDDKGNNKAITSPTTTTTEKPRAVRDTNNPTTPKTERSTEENIQKIPADGRVHLEGKGLDSSVLNIGQDGPNENKNAPNVPNMPIPLQLQQTKMNSNEPKVKTPFGANLSDEDGSSKSSGVGKDARKQMDGKVQEMFSRSNQ